MSWLRDHFHNFVFPAFMAAEKKSTEIGRPFHVTPSRFAPERLPTELKKLWTLCREHGVEWSYDVRVLNNHGGTSKYRETARLHHKILRETLESAVVAMRREGCTRILLPGRDIYMLAPMCARRGIPYLFVPELSRAVSDNPVCRPYLERLGVDGRELLLDTGYVGSIPKNLGKHFGVEFKFRLLSEYDRPEVPKDRSAFERRPHQVFPNRQKSRQEALETEYLAKYWKCATIQRNVKQGHAPTVLAEWSRKPNVSRFWCDRYLGGGRDFCVYDGKEVVRVSDTGLRLAPDFVAWWESLPQYEGANWVEGTDPHDMPVRVEEEIVQYFADRKSIQRAALLTSMLFRGIPFWKVSAPKKGAIVYDMATANNFNVVNNVGWLVTNGVNSAVTTMMNFSSAAGTASTATTYIQQGIPMPTPLTPAAAQAALAATQKAQAPPPLPPAAGAPIGLLPPAPASAAVPVAPVGAAAAV